MINVGSGDYGGRRSGGWQPRYYQRHGWNNNRHGWRRDRWGRHGGYYRDRDLGGAIVGGLITGAIVGGVLNNSGPVYRERVYRGGDAHIQCAMTATGPTARRTTPTCPASASVPTATRLTTKAG